MLVKKASWLTYDVNLKPDSLDCNLQDISKGHIAWMADQFPLIPSFIMLSLSFLWIVLSFVKGRNKHERGTTEALNGCKRGKNLFEKKDYDIL